MSTSFDYSKLRTRKWAATAGLNISQPPSLLFSQSCSQSISLLPSQGSSSSGGKPRYQCGKCDKVLCTLSGFRNHLRRTHGEESCFPCKECDRTFRHASGLCQHRHSYHGKMSLECKKCQRVFNSRGNLKRHLQTHTQSVEELEDFWKQNYVQTQRQAKALERSQLLNEIIVEPKQEASSTSSDDSQPIFAPLIYKASEVAELRNPKMPRFNHLKLGSTIFPSLARFHEGKIFPHPYVDEDDSSFGTFSCSSCKLSHVSRLELENHFYREHPSLMDSGRYCEICMKLVKDMSVHLRYHQTVLSEVKRCSLLPEPYTSLLSL